MLMLVIRPLVKAATGGVKSGVPESAPLEPDFGESPAAAGARGEDEGGGAEVIDLAERLRRHVDAYKHISTEDLSELVRKEADNSAEVLRRWMKK
jgi:flagellar biosynthesis/type III secretory pathway M-ring protein FliF/YscJ